MLRTAIKRQFLSARNRRFISSASRTVYNRTLTRPIFKASMIVAGGIMAYQLTSTTAHAEEPPKIVIEETELEIPDIVIAENIEALGESEQVAAAVVEELIEEAETAALIEAEAETNAEQEKGAYDPETGEINWDCPCLGGMANGPCGEEFKDAFSCFVYSETDPKGSNCIEKFAAMQSCFRKHPDVYADELAEESPIDREESAVRGESAVGGESAVRDESAVKEQTPAEKSD